MDPNIESQTFDAPYRSSFTHILNDAEETDVAPVANVILSSSDDVGGRDEDSESQSMREGSSSGGHLLETWK